MSWRNIRLIYAREIRDQLRDRRTLFMIAVLPLILYPLLGMSVFQLSQFLRKSEPKVLVIGNEQVTGDLPPLFEDGRFAADLFDNPTTAERLHIEFIDREESAAETELATSNEEDERLAAEKRLKLGDVQVVLLFPVDFHRRLRELRSQINGREERAVTESAGNEPNRQPLVPIEVPQPELYFNSGKEISRIAHMEIEQALNAWKTRIIRENLEASRVPINVARPFELKPHDVAELHQQRALLWSKVLPFVLFIWGADEAGLVTRAHARDRDQRDVRMATAVEQCHLDQAA